MLCGTVGEAAFFVRQDRRQRAGLPTHHWRQELRASTRVSNDRIGGNTPGLHFINPQYNFVGQRAITNCLMEQLIMPQFCGWTTVVTVGLRTDNGCLMRLWWCRGSNKSGGIISWTRDGGLTRKRCHAPILARCANKNDLLSQNNSERLNGPVLLIEV